MLPNRLKSYSGITDFIRDPAITEPILYDLSKDISESKNVAKLHPEIVKKLIAIAEKAPIDLEEKTGNK
jgi:hypothetical protein